SGNFATPILLVAPVDFELSSVGTSIEPPIDVNVFSVPLLSIYSSTDAFTAMSVPDKSATLCLDLYTGILLFPESVKVDVSLLVFCIAFELPEESKLFKLLSVLHDNNK
ncbi:hypothetical protein, partial [Borreliella valaisiana]|uniref:hypothetical protein n=1 Tax=Borreliella valaisiana TaxID=62088 RepID=UPI001AEF9CE5